MGVAVGVIPAVGAGTHHKYPLLYVIALHGTCTLLFFIFRRTNEVTGLSMSDVMRVIAPVDTVLEEVKTYPILAYVP
jgi:hypothetical protein